MGVLGSLDKRCNFLIFFFFFFHSSKLVVSFETVGGIECGFSVCVEGVGEVLGEW